MRSYERVIEEETPRPQVERRRKLMKVCVLWVAAVIVNVLTYRLISVAALDFQKKHHFSSQIHNGRGEMRG